MATAGSAVGIGSLWRFPYIAGENGGGAFILLYLLFTFFLGVPVFLAELIIGRKTQQSSALAYSTLSNHSSNWKMLGYFNILSCLLILSFYSVVSGWCLSYTLMSITQFTKGKSLTEIQEVFTTLYSAPGINIFWLALFLLANVAIILAGVRKGIEHWSKILMPALLAILIGLFLYATTLSGFGKALSFTFYPDFSKLNPSAMLNALGMAFFTLSAGLGIIVTYGSYMHKNQNIPYNGLIVAIMTVFVSLIAALTIFPIVFTFDFPPSQGPGLVFQTLPVLFAKLPATILLSTIFFALLVFAALTSTISLLEMIVANLIELYDMSRTRATLLSAFAAFLIGIPCALSGSQALFPAWESIYGKNFFDTVSYLALSWMMPIGGLFTVLFVGWWCPKQAIYQEFLQGSKTRFFVHPWYFLVRYVAPIAVIIIILQESGILHFGGN